MSDPTVFAAIGAAIDRILKQEPALSPNIFRGRTRPIPEQMASAINVRVTRGIASRAPLKGQSMDWSTQVGVECYGRGASEVEAEEAAGALMAAVYARLAASPDLEGLAMDTLPGEVRFEGDSESDHQACATVVYQVLHRTQGGTIQPT